MRWLRLVGFFKLLVSFAEYSLFYRALLQKRPIHLGALFLHIEELSHVVAAISSLLKSIGLFCKRTL